MVCADLSIKKLWCAYFHTHSLHPYLIHIGFGAPRVVGLLRRKARSSVCHTCALLHGFLCACTDIVLFHFLLLSSNFTPLKGQSQTCLCGKCLHVSRGLPTSLLKSFCTSGVVIATHQEDWRIHTNTTGLKCQLSQHNN